MTIVKIFLAGMILFAFIVGGIILDDRNRRR